MEARVKAGLWVSMATRMSDIAGRPATVVRRGDADAGGVLCALLGRQGVVVLAQARDGEGRLIWMRGTGPAPVPEREADAYIARQVDRDPDLWVVEFEAPDYLPPFEATLV